MREVIKLEHVWKEFRMPKQTVTVLRDINLEVKEREFLAILGPSGSGKSTLLYVLSCLMKPSKGKVYIDGKDVSKLSENELAKIRNETIGFVFQQFNLMPRLSALENVMLPLWFKGVPKLKREKIAKRLLIELGLEERMHHKPNELSGGQQQRVAIARALACNPSVIVADEPTGNLDSKAGK